MRSAKRAEEGAGSEAGLSLMRLLERVQELECRVSNLESAVQRLERVCRSSGGRVRVPTEVATSEELEEDVLVDEEVPVVTGVERGQEEQKESTGSRRSDAPVSTEVFSGASHQVEEDSETEPPSVQEVLVAAVGAPSRSGLSSRDGALGVTAGASRSRSRSRSRLQERE